MQTQPTPQDAGSPEYPGVGGVAHWLGIEIVGWDAGSPHPALPVRDEFINRNGAMHGGVLVDGVIRRIDDQNGVDEASRLDTHAAIGDKTA